MLRVRTTLELGSRKEQTKKQEEGTEMFTMNLASRTIGKSRPRLSFSEVLRHEVGKGIPGRMELGTFLIFDLEVNGQDTTSPGVQARSFHLADNQRTKRNLPNKNRSNRSMKSFTFGLTFLGTTPYMNIRPKGSS